MKQLKRFALAGAVALVLGACSDNTPKQVSIGTGNIELNAPANVASMTVKSGTYTFTDVTTGAVTEIGYPLPADASVAEGLYNVKFEGEAEVLVDLTKADEVAATPVTVRMQGVQNNVVVKGDGSFKLTLLLSVVPEASDDFVISEIYYVGSAYPADASGKQKQYNGDAYVKITNNSDQVLYADGLVLCESEFQTSTKRDGLNPDIRSSAVSVDCVMAIPGSGTDHPVQPGESIVLCDNAQNHKEADPSFMDLSRADFEWFTNSTLAAYPDVDNPAVPNLDIYYCYTATIFVLHKQGCKGYALARLPQGVTREKWLGEYTYTYNYTLITGKPSRNIVCYKIPNEWVVDAVEFRGYKYEFAWPVFDPSFDISYTYCGDLNAGRVDYGTAVRRKTAYVAEDGRRVLQDTNNSAEDFERNVTPSMK
ncbi:DUF4876 domain-containing protein [uncultured Rikenella sp.]|uniref:DUF4876 domain-containing protein n=1 Tax=uncultured Rikenella sp. TaxID=368003 RepID=UPI00261134D5|nr:DUF4876 domain-containing protein [uncultured Rikenella sp.]